MQHMEGQRPLAAIEVGLGFHTDLLSPYVLKIPVPPAQAIVSVIDTTPDRSKRGAQLDARIAVRDERLYVAGVVRLDDAA